MIGNRLKRAREAVGLSLPGPERRHPWSGVSPGHRQVRARRNDAGSTVLLALSKALHITPEFLLSEREVELTGVDFRRRQAGAKEERAVEASVLDC